MIALIGLSSFRPGGPDFSCNPLIYNTGMARLFHPEGRMMPFQPEQMRNIEPDTISHARVLMLDYSAYGSAYNEKVKTIIGKSFPKSVFADFQGGSAEELTRALETCDVVVIAYPSTSPELATGIRMYGKILNLFLQQGGGVVLTGTHEFEALQQFGLFELDFGYFSKELPFHGLQADHPVFAGITPDFTALNFAYPLDISDPGFVTLAEVGGYPAVGYKAIGAGRMVYLGIEYYYDEDNSSHMLANAVRWASRQKPVEAPASVVNAQPEPVSRSFKRSEEYLYSGSGSDGDSDPVDLKIYPNPYYSKATLDIEVSKPTTVKAEMTDESGRGVALVLPRKSVGTGLCRIELPNIAPGIYFLQVQVGDQTYVKKVVKAASN